jgi:hypothetical protein
MKYTQMKYLKLVILAFVLIGASCKKEAVKVDGNFLGQWESIDPNFDIYININSGSFSGYLDETGNTTESHMGKATVKKKKNQMFIEKKELSIDQYPHQITDSLGHSVWRMKLSNVEYEKY